ncbi:MAG: D-alanyl-D-alanine carboxypeptidase family protein [Cellulosilyticaceae bacterium]
MIKLKHIFILFVFYCFSFSLSLGLPSPTLQGEGALLLEASTGKVLYAKNPTYRFYPASTTKVLTTLLLAESFDIDATLTKSPESMIEVPADSSHIGLSVGDTYSYKDGLHAILMGSDNYVSYDMAIHNSGSIQAFVDKMNAKAASLGATSTHFVNPHGYHDPNHYTTPYDLALITQAAFANPIVTQVAGTPTHNFTIMNKEKTLPLTHTAASFKKESPYYNPHIVAAKTGYHTPAGRTLVAKAVYGDLELIGVVMKSGSLSRFEDINKLFEYGSQNFRYTLSSDGTSSLENISYAPWAKPHIEHAIKQGLYQPTLRSYMDPSTAHSLSTLLEKATLGVDLESAVHLPATAPSRHYTPLLATDAQKIFQKVASLRGVELPSQFITTSLSPYYAEVPTTLSIEDSIYLVEAFQLFLLTTDPTYTLGF